MNFFFFWGGDLKKWPQSRGAIAPLPCGSTAGITPVQLGIFCQLWLVSNASAAFKAKDLDMARPRILALRTRPRTNITGRVHVTYEVNRKVLCPIDALRASCGAVYCNRSCLLVDVCLRVAGYVSKITRKLCASILTKLGL